MSSSRILAPISIGFDHDALLPEIEDAFPFDTGAFVCDMYKAVIGTIFEGELNLFCLTQADLIKNLLHKRFVRAFFGDNQSYYTQAFNESVKYDHSAAVEYCIDLAKALCQDFDGRASTVEVHVDRDISPLNKRIDCMFIPDFIEDFRDDLQWLKENNVNFRVYKWRAHRHDRVGQIISVCEKYLFEDNLDRFQ